MWLEGSFLGSVTQRAERDNQRVHHLAPASQHGNRIVLAATVDHNSFVIKIHAVDTVRGILAASLAVIVELSFGISGLIK